MFSRPILLWFQTSEAKSRYIWREEGDSSSGDSDSKSEVGISSVVERWSASDRKQID